MCVSEQLVHRGSFHSVTMMIMQLTSQRLRNVLKLLKMICCSGTTVRTWYQHTTMISIYQTRRTSFLGVWCRIRMKELHSPFHCRLLTPQTLISTGFCFSRTYPSSAIIQLGFEDITVSKTTKCQPFIHPRFSAHHLLRIWCKCLLHEYLLSSYWHYCFVCYFFS